MARFSASVQLKAKTTDMASGAPMSFARAVRVDSTCRAAATARG